MEDKRTIGQCMREGAKFRGQADGGCYDFKDKTSCALGAVWEALIGSDSFKSDPYFNSEDLTRRFGRRFPWTCKEVECPLCDVPASVLVVVPHLNDTMDYTGLDRRPNHHMSREWIADWLDSIDPTAPWNMHVGEPRREIYVEPVQEPQPLQEPQPKQEPVEVPEEEEVPA